ncbi:hypothetical protein N0V85_006826 [Neurospora sp. IMI 360204]|nr:hypothetical protein N0V85_006826 [Neurospora sp. IMI 360204]
MAPITQNVTNQIVDALTPLLSTAPAVISATPTVNLNVTIINTSVEPTTTASSSLIGSVEYDSEQAVDVSPSGTIESMTSSGPLFGLPIAAPVERITLPVLPTSILCGTFQYLAIPPTTTSPHSPAQIISIPNCTWAWGGVIVVILFVVRFCKQRKWPQTPQEEMNKRQLEVAERIENGLRSIESGLYDHHDLQARQMDLLLKHHGVKDRPCLHPRWECHTNKCPPTRSRRYDTWELEQTWSDYGSQESLIPHGLDEQSKPDVERQSGTELGSEKKSADVPSGWTRLSESVVENQSVTDWGSHEKLVWLGGPEEGSLYGLHRATPKLKSA